MNAIPPKPITISDAALRLPTDRARRLLETMASPFCAVLSLPDAALTLAWVERWAATWGRDQ